VNVTEIVQEAVGARVVPQVELCAKSPSVAMLEMLERRRADVAESVATCGLEVVPHRCGGEVAAWARGSRPARAWASRVPVRFSTSGVVTVLEAKLMLAERTRSPEERR